MPDTNAPAADPVAIAQALIRCPSVTPAEGGALAYLEDLLTPHGFTCHRVTFSDQDTPDVENLYARWGTEAPVIVFAGHTDVVPPGDEERWRHPPFAAEIEGGILHGRGASDMKGGIAAFAAAAIGLVTQAPPMGSVVLLVTGDEEGPSINGTRKLLAWAHERGERFDGAVVGEPTNPLALGDMIKIGRRGSMSGTIAVAGVQGHVAYPHLAANPVPGLVAVVSALLAEPLDQGTEHFPASNLEVTSIDVGNPAHNVIPARATAAFNIRFNDLHTFESLKDHVTKAAQEALTSPDLSVEVAFHPNPSDVFLTRADDLIEAFAGAVEAETGRRPELSTTGGTSDARYIKDYCPVVEFGLVGQTMHQVDEHVAVDDIEALTRIYRRFLTRMFDGR